MMIPDRPYNKFLEDVISTAYQTDVGAIAVVIVAIDGATYTAYFNTSQVDKYLIACRIAEDAILEAVTMETVARNKDYIEKLLGKTDDDEEETSEPVDKGEE